MAKCKECGNSGLTLKTNSDGICMDCLTRQLKEMAHKYAKLEARITPEFEEAERLTEKLKHDREAANALAEDIQEKQQEVEGLENQIAKAKDSLLVASDDVEMESFGLYLPRFEFAKSDDYKERLASCRARQKQMVRDKEAVLAQEGWSVNGSASEGKKLITDMSKLFLRAFNNECDIAINDVKFSNMDKSRERILKAFEDINGLGRVNNMTLSFQYRQLKLDELALAYEYQCKKQEEKEALRALREQQREEAKVAKEIAEARKEAEKERKHYLQALEKLRQQVAEAATEEDRQALTAKQDDLINHLDELNQKMEDIDYRQENQRAGYVYVISNIGSFGEDVYKIGMTRRLDPMERVYELGDASVPFMFDVHAMIFSDDAPKLEAALHQAFADKRVNAVNARREYFRVSLEEIKQVVRENHDKTVEFVDTPDAQQYRESLLIQGR